MESYPPRRRNTAQHSWVRPLTLSALSRLSCTVWPWRTFTWERETKWASVFMSEHQLHTCNRYLYLNYWRVFSGRSVRCLSSQKKRYMLSHSAIVCYMGYMLKIFYLQLNFSNELDVRHICGTSITVTTGWLDRSLIGEQNIVRTYTVPPTPTD